MLYRRGVGIMLCNEQSLIFVGLRKDINNVWQMPQGGIKSGEDENTAMFRELKEETGLNSHSVEIIAKSKEYLHYNLPENLSSRLWGGMFIGQKQKWFLLRFMGVPDDIDINIGYRSEFKDWQWQKKQKIINNVVYFKKNLYEKVFNEFKSYL